METFSFTVVILGIVVGLALLIKNRTIMRSLTGSFFRRSYSFATLGSIFLALSFAIESLNWVGFNNSIIDPIHHLLLLCSSISLFYVALIFPKEVESALSGKK